MQILDYVQASRQLMREAFVMRVAVYSKVVEKQAHSPIKANVCERLL